VLAEGDPATSAQIYAEVLARTPPISRPLRTCEMLHDGRRPRSGQADLAMVRNRSEATRRSRPSRHPSISPSRPRRLAR